MDEREKFEQWMKTAKLYGRDMAPDAWDAWQARAALASEPAPDRVQRGEQRGEIVKAYALVQGPRRKVLYVSDSVPMLFTLGAETFSPSASSSVRFARNERMICKENDAYVVRIDFKLGEPITKPRKRVASKEEPTS